MLYLGLATVTVGVLGTTAPSAVPLADLMSAGLGSPGRTGTILVAVLLTLGTMSAYVAAAVRLVGALAPAHPIGAPPRALAVFSVTTAGLLCLLAAGVLDVAELIRASSAAFVAVYAAATLAGVRLLRGRARGSAGVSAVAILVVLAFAGWSLVVPVVVAGAALAAARAPGGASREPGRGALGPRSCPVGATTMEGP